MKFTEKSLTQPGQAYSAGEIIRRSLNGTMPAIYHDGSYDLKEDLYENQESDDSFIDSEPQLEDVAALQENLLNVREALQESVAKAKKRHFEKQNPVPGEVSTSSKPAKPVARNVEGNPATAEGEIH